LPGPRTLELGAGTGLATAMLSRAGLSVTALEPGANLAAVLRGKGLPDVTVIESSFEAWPGADGTYDCVASAQAIHWIDPAVRYVKAAAALGPRGMLAVIRNEMTWPDAAFRSELSAAYVQWYGGDGRPDTPDDVEREYRGEITASGRFGPIDVLRFPWAQRHTAASYVALLETYSDHVTLPPGRKTGLYAAVAAAIDRRGGAIEVEYVSLLFLAPRMR
jgi:SAM-dependent methyltransferase